MAQIHTDFSESNCCAAGDQFGICLIRGHRFHLVGSRIRRSSLLRIAAIHALGPHAYTLGVVLGS